MTERGRFQVHDCLSDRRDDAFGEPGSRAGLEFTGEGLARYALAPAAQTRVAVGGAEVELLAPQTQLLMQPFGGGVRYFAGNDQGIRAEHDTKIITYPPRALMTISTSKQSHCG